MDFYDDFYDDFHDEFSDELSDEFEDEREQRPVQLSRRRIPLNLHRNYARLWTPDDAFRELYQNWNDGMIESFGIKQPNRIRRRVTDTAEEWLATAHLKPLNESEPSEASKLIGFIRFHKRTGSVAVSNFWATLSEDSLYLGVSTKDSNKLQAGGHGEGLKIASLVLVRNGYQVRIESASQYWTFNNSGRDQQRFVCNLNPMKSDKLDKLKAADAQRKQQGQIRDCKSNIWEDVTVCIGKVYGSTGRPINFGEFLRWTQVSLHLQSPSKMVTTPSGDLVLDESLRGRMYLKGLLLGRSVGLKKVKYTYNFYEGEINRDRQMMTNPHEEARQIAGIWSGAVSTDAKHYGHLYASLLKNEAYDDFADVSFVAKHISKNIAAVVWQCIKEMEAQTPDAFFYDVKEAEHYPIKHALKKTPVALPEHTWKALYQYDLIMTPQEYQRHLFQNAPNAEIPPSIYVKEFKRMLETGFALQKGLDKFDLVFKESLSVGPDMILDGRKLLIDAKFLHFDRTHEHAKCSISSRQETERQHPCDHTVEQIFESTIQEFLSQTEPDGPQTIRYMTLLKDIFRIELRQMVRAVKIAHGESSGELIVKWTDVENAAMFQLHEVDMQCRVTLHRERSCANIRAEYLSLSGLSLPLDGMIREKMVANIISSYQSGWADDQDVLPPCACESQVVSQRLGTAKFTSLASSESYFPMIARLGGLGFFAMPPGSLSPASPELLRGPSMALSPQSKQEVQSEADIYSDSEHSSHRLSREGIIVLSESIQSVAENTDDSFSRRSYLPSPGGDDISEDIDHDSLQPLTYTQSTGELTRLKDDLQIKQQELTEVRAQFTLNRRKLSMAEERIERLEAELRESHANLESQQEQAQRRIDDLLDDIRRLTNQVQHREAEIQKLRAQTPASRLVLPEHGSVRSLQNFEELQSKFDIISKKNETLVATLSAAADTIQFTTSFSDREKILRSMVRMRNQIHDVLDESGMDDTTARTRAKRERELDDGEAEDGDVKRARPQIKGEVILLD